MKVSKVSYDDFNIRVSRGELSTIRVALQEMRAGLRKKAANCTSCGIKAAEIHWMIEPLNEIIKEAIRDAEEIEVKVED